MDCLEDGSLSLDVHLRSLRYTVSVTQRLVDESDLDDGFTFSMEGLQRLRRDFLATISTLEAAVSDRDRFSRPMDRRPTDKSLLEDMSDGEGSAGEEGNGAPSDSVSPFIAPAFEMVAIGEERATIGGTVLDLDELEEEVLNSPSKARRGPDPRGRAASPRAPKTSPTISPAKQSKHKREMNGTAAAKTRRGAPESAPEDAPRRHTIHHRKPKGESAAMPKRASTCAWGAGAMNGRNPSSVKLKKKAARFKRDEEQAFRARVRAAYQRHGTQRFDKECLKRLMLTLGRGCVPNGIFDAHLSHVDAEKHLPEAEVERIVWGVEMMRAREVLKKSRQQSDQLLSVAGAEEFTRVVGDASHGWFGMPLMLPNAWYIQNFDVCIMRQSALKTRGCQVSSRVKKLLAF